MTKLCPSCYQKRGYKAGQGESWTWPELKKNKWGKTLKEREGCIDCGTTEGLFTDLPENVWKEARCKFLNLKNYKIDDTFKEKDTIFRLAQRYKKWADVSSNTHR